MKIERIYLVSNEQSNCLNAIDDPDCTKEIIVSMLHDANLADAQAAKNGTTRLDRRKLADAVLKRWPESFERINDAVVKRARDFKEGGAGMAKRKAKMKPPTKLELYVALQQALRELDRLGANDNDDTVGPNETVAGIKRLLTRAGYNYGENHPGLEGE